MICWRMSQSDSKLRSGSRTLTRTFRRWICNSKDGSGPALCLIIAVIGFFMGLAFDVDREGYSFKPDVFPVEAVNWLEQNPQEGNVFNYFPWGGYLLYRDWPDTPVFIDGQTDFYGEALSRKYMQVLNAEEGWESVMQEYDIAWAILPIEEFSTRMIQLELGWHVIYEDETAIILHR